MEGRGHGVDPMGRSLERAGPKGNKGWALERRGQLLGGTNQCSSN